MEHLEQRLEAVNAKIARTQAANDCIKCMGLYAHYRSSGTKEAFTALYDLFAKHTPGTVYGVAGMGLWKEDTGLQRVFLNWLRDAKDEQFSRCLFRHDITSPVIHVAADGKTAKAVFGSIGVETITTDGEDRISCWAMGTYDAAFVLEDGEWKIWKLFYRPIFSTPYDGMGWTEIPELAAPMRDAALANPAFAPDERLTNSRPFNNAGTLSYVQCGIPEPPVPYATWEDSMFDPYARPEDHLPVFGNK